MFSRVAFVTGASRGIGREIALTLCRAGFDIAVASPEIEKNEEVAEKIRACSGQALAVNLDLLSYDSIRAGFAKALQQFGRIDVLVNNAGVTRDGLAVRMKREDWDRVLQIDLHGAFFAIQQVLPSMMKQRYGRIVNISSIVGESGNAGQANYVAAKAGLIGLTKALAQEMAPRGGAGIHRHRHDGGDDGRTETETARASAFAAARPAGGDRGRGAFSG